MKICRVAIVHYHLHSGGVTRVIEQGLTALQQAGIDAVVLTGDDVIPVGIPPHKVRVLPELGYAGGDAIAVDPVGLSLRMERTARDALGGECDLWHVHNHSLGKNPALTLAIHSLAERGGRLLLQIHDFAEDGRPRLYGGLRTVLQHRDIPFDELLYPRGANVHYALLNSTDRRLLQHAGADPDRLHLLPNPVVSSAVPYPPGKPPSGQTLFLYPVRGIRRKNLGECLLLSALADVNARFAITLPPDNPKARVVYDFWRTRSRELGLPVAFGVGGRMLGIDALMARAAAAVTTSVAEGFGLGFLEPWALQRGVVGRDLPRVTRDFCDADVSLEHLYTALRIPLSWFHVDRFKERLEAAYREDSESYGRTVTPAALDALIAGVIGDTDIDFGQLDELAQDEILTQVVNQSRKRDQLRQMTPALAPPDERLVAHNAKAVAKAYGMQPFMQRIFSAYASVAGSQAGAPGRGISSGRLLDRFQDPLNYNILRAS